MSDNPSNTTPQPAPTRSQAVQPAPAAAAPAALSTEAQALYNQFTLVDPTRSGAGLDKIRVFYPKVGWNVIFGMVHELEQAGRLKKRAVMSPRGTVAYHVYTWQEG